ncbi:MAG TPA: ATP12 family protein [Microvirga sp.]|jgi:chaperone required for assembly of F1-ATPase|nr:ATP12 family protein [Microvirga sp.]
MTDTVPTDWFPSAEEPNPMRAAQAGMKNPLPKRFYKEAGVDEREGAFHLALDGRHARTPARHPLALPTRALAEAVAAEWARQGETVDPTTMPVTRIVNSAIDGVSARREEVVDDIAKYAGSDLTCYRAGEPERLAREQGAAWDPVIAWARESLGARFSLAEGVMHVAQPADAMAAVRERVQRIRSPFALAGLHVMTTLTGSVLIALAHAEGRFDADAAWAAAHADELYQESVWGEDAEAQARRRTREADFMAASQVYHLSVEA